MKYIALITTSILFFSGVGFGQNTNLPLTSVGLGDIRSTVHASQLGMGGLNSTYANPNLYNIYNPASLASLRNTSLGISAFGDANLYENSSQSETQWDGGIDYLHLAFPLQNIFNESLREEKSPIRVGAAFSLQPYSRISYSIISRFEPEDTPHFESLSEGEGETYTANVSIGAGYKNFSLGFDAGLFFGSNEIADLILFDDRSISASLVEDQIGFQGFNYKIGAMYQFIINKNLTETNRRANNKSITIGATFASQRKVRTITDHLELAIPINSALIDTLNFSGGIKDNFKLPTSYSVGISYYDGKRWLIGMDYEASNWSSTDHAFLGENGLNDAFRLSVGAEFIPDRNSFNSYFEKVRYRGGAFMGRDYRTLDGGDWNTMGFNLGLGFPIALPRQKTTFVDLAFEWGQYDLPVDDLNNSYYRINLGLTINDNTWFFKQKYQ